jgi:hypothetical protein
MKSHFNLAKTLVEHLLIAVGSLDCVQQVHVIRNGDLEERAFGLDLIRHGTVEFVRRPANIRAILLHARRRSPLCAFEFYMVQQRGFRIRNMRDFIHRDPQLIGRHAALYVKFPAAHTYDVREGATAQQRQQQATHACVVAYESR